MKLLLAGLSGLALASSGAAGASLHASSAAAAAGGIRVTLISPTHTPKVNVAWPVRITVTNAAGKPLAATVTMRVLFSGTPVGLIDNGAVYHFVGSWQEKPGNGITWPEDAKGEPLTFQATVVVDGKTFRKDWSIDVE